MVLSRRAAKVACRGAYAGGTARDKIPFDIPRTENDVGSFLARIIKQNQNCEGVLAGTVS